MLVLTLLLIIPLALEVALLDQSLDALRGDDDTGAAAATRFLAALGTIGLMVAPGDDALNGNVNDDVLAGDPGRYAAGQRQ